MFCTNLDLNVYSLATGTSERLVNHDARIGHRVALALGARSQQERPHGRGQAEAVCLHIRSAQLRITEVNSAPIAAIQDVRSLSKSEIALHARASADNGAALCEARVGLQLCVLILQNQQACHLHCVVDAHSSCHRASRGIDEELDVLHWPQSSAHMPRHDRFAERECPMHAHAHAYM